MVLLDRIETAACGCEADHAQPLLSVSEATDRLRAAVAPLIQIETIPLGAALGRVLARDVAAATDLPRFDNSGMDGYALRAGDLPNGAGLPVLGEACAGAPVGRLTPGSAMRINTGAPVPAGADTVVMQEQVRRIGDRIDIDGQVRPGQNIRRRGEDRKCGTILLSAGTRLDARAIGVCAAAGAGRVAVRRAPDVALLLTGDEVRPAGETLGSGAIWDVNAPMLAAAITEAGGRVAVVRHVDDCRQALIQAISEAAAKTDLVVTSGGVSVGERDHVRPALAALAARTVFSGVAIKPGKPITLAMLDGTPVLGLPGNPMSAYVTWHLFGRSVLARLAGERGASTARRHVRAAQGITHKPGRCEYRPARIEGYDSDGMEIVHCQPRTESARMSQLLSADGLVLIPADADILHRGDLLEFLPIGAAGPRRM
ncbi:molybdopterin molybdotransferase MoeA [Thalassococcus sp. CAU 1522]|uniref:Molybdopterin molybdenumtransferase n=1 Tax=Thalassococcus arenae TaxID=2851652 RepID=A0ABS6NDE1_9RHOB|nr:gephyrin-like molybdotransferase Glp [Thalassococcus arenae]MBV2361629.1 molybdopterin molybdotransferase MoeA [Thalassococcus arenae]